MPRPPSDLQSSPLPDREREICARFRQVRLDEGMKQGPFAERLEIPLTRLKSYEMARAPIRYSLAVKLGEGFDINQHWLSSGLFTKRPYFRPDPTLQECIDQRQLFSRVFDLVICEHIYESLIRYTSPNLTESFLGADALPFGGSSMFVRKRGLEYLEQRLAKASRELPNIPFHELQLEVEKLIGKHLGENQKVRDEYISGQKRRDVELKARYEAFVRDRLARGLVFPPGLSIEQIRKEGVSPIRGPKSENYFLTHDESLTYSAERNENHPRSMQKNIISQRIKKARESLGLSQSQAAEKWNIRLQTIQQWEHGRREPRGLYRERIEKILAEIEQKA